ncbi:MAG: hypothetical protein ACR2RL_21755 [Gammaproteobacteria bacterium]
MTPEQALTHIDALIASIAMTRQQHAEAQLAALTVRNALFPPAPGAVTPMPSPAEQRIKQEAK